MVQVLAPTVQTKRVVTGGEELRTMYAFTSVRFVSAAFTVSGLVSCAAPPIPSSELDESKLSAPRKKTASAAADGGEAPATPTPSTPSTEIACKTSCVASNAAAAAYLRCSVACASNQTCDETCFTTSCGSQTTACDSVLQQCDAQCAGGTGTTPKPTPTPTPTPPPGTPEACMNQCAANGPGAQYWMCSANCQDALCDENCFERTCGSNAQQCDAHLSQCSQRCGF